MMVVVVGRARLRTRVAKMGLAEAGNLQEAMLLRR